jgi:hypothetical protein
MFLLELRSLSSKKETVKFRRLKRIDPKLVSMKAKKKRAKEKYFHK